MKTIFYLILTSFISTGAYMAGLNQENGLPCFAVAFAAWGLFFWGWYKRSQKAAGNRSGR
jgi:hypothetical protein